VIDNSELRNQGLENFIVALHPFASGPIASDTALHTTSLTAYHTALHTAHRTLHIASYCTITVVIMNVSPSFISISFPFFYSCISLSSFQIIVKKLLRTNFCINFHDPYTVSVRDVMDAITARIGTPQEQQRLLHHGQVLHDGFYLHEYGLGPPQDCPYHYALPPIVIICTLRISGGARTCSKFNAHLSAISRPLLTSTRGKISLDSSASIKKRRDRFLHIMKGNYRTRQEKKLFDSFVLPRARDPIFIPKRNVPKLMILEARSLYITIL